VYCEEDLGLRRKRPWRHVTSAHRVQKQPAGRPNVVWGMDFVADQLSDGRKIRTLTIIDLFTRECLGIEIGFNLRGDDVVEAMNHLEYARGVAQRISCDNGSEFSGGQMDLWAYTHKVQMDFNRPGKPTDNATVESFNGKFRDECLNTHWFESIPDAKKKIDAWRWDYNEHPPHRSLEGLTPRELAVKSGSSGPQNHSRSGLNFPGRSTRPSPKGKLVRGKPAGQLG
jgi:putative transposase